MKKILKKWGILLLAMILTVQSLGYHAYAAEVQEDVDLKNVESILSWIEQNIPEDLNMLADMPREWWDSLLPNQTRIAENLLMPVNSREEYSIEQLAYVPEEGDQVANMNLASTGITDGYGSTLWKITNGGGNVFCLDHGASCKRSYHYGNFQKINGEAAYLIEKYGQSSTVSGYICIQMAVWALMSASTEAEAYAYAYTWYLKSYDAAEAASWAETTVQFFKLANMAESFSEEYSLIGGNRILSEVVGISFTEYVRADETAMVQWLALLNGETTNAGFFNAYAMWLDKSSSSRTDEERWSYYESFHKVKHAVVEEAPGSRDKDGYLLSGKRSKERLEELIARYEIKEEQ